MTGSVYGWCTGCTYCAVLRDAGSKTIPGPDRDAKLVILPYCVIPRRLIVESPGVVELPPPGDMGRFTGSLDSTPAMDLRLDLGSGLGGGFVSSSAFLFLLRYGVVLYCYSA